jgi:hypothetical protein
MRPGTPLRRCTTVSIQPRDHRSVRPRELNHVPERVSAPETKDDAEGRLFWEGYLVVVLAGPAAHKKRHPYAHWLGYKIGDMRDAYDVIERHDA